MNLIETLHWRYAVKKFSNQKVSEENLNHILKATALSASSTGLQPYRLFVIDDPEIREDLAKDSFNAQIREASHLIAFTAFTGVSEDHIDHYMEFTAKERGVPAEALEPFKNSLKAGLLSRTDEENYQWAARQAYIALGTALIAAADVKVDATPMEGFNSDKLDDLLQLTEKGLKSVVLLALGYRDAANDFLSNQKKVRLPLEEFVKKVA